MYYPCSENKDADQLRGYREADLRLCFRPCKLLVFSRTGSYNNHLNVNCRLILYMYSNLTKLQDLNLHVEFEISTGVLILL